MAVAFGVAVLPITAVAGTGRFGVAPAVAAVLTAAYGLGNLAGSVGVMIRPLHGDADRLMTCLALVVAAALLGVAVAPTSALAVPAYAAAGIANSYFFATTLAARNEYAPAEARGQVFVWIGALKITAGSAGTALAGAIVGITVHLPLALVIAITTACAALSALARRDRGRLTER